MVGDGGVGVGVSGVGVGVGGVGRSGDGSRSGVPLWLGGRRHLGSNGVNFACFIFARIPPISHNKRTFRHTYSVETCPGNTLLVPIERFDVRPPGGTITECRTYLVLALVPGAMTIPIHDA